ncbi:hypothetical protein RKD37_005550 [Streptomyces ambofaciens]
MEPVTLTTDRLVLRTVGPQDIDAVHAACQDPDIQRWTTVPSPYLPEHARSFVEQMVSDGWANDSMFTFGLFLPAGDLVGMLGVTMISLGVGEIGFWGTKEHRGLGHITEGRRRRRPLGLHRAGRGPPGVARRGRQHGLPRGGPARGLHRGGHVALRDQQQGRPPRLLGRLPPPLRPRPPFDVPVLAGKGVAG